MHIKSEDIVVSQQNWKLFTLINDNGMEVSCLNYGGIITKILAPDQNNNFENVVLSFKDYETYLENPGHLGALIGRVAGRIPESQFELDGITYTLEANDGPNHLHGGPTGFNAVIWDVTPFENEGTVGLTLTHSSPDSEGGYPGAVDIQVTYALNNNNQFSIFYQASSTKKTPLALTNHCYFNLSGNLKTDILNHQVTLDSNSFVELDHKLIPTGRKLSVDDTVFDFREGRRIEDGVLSNHEQNLIVGNGYDHNFILDHKKEASVVVKDFGSGRELVVETEQPGLIMYTSNMLDDDLQLTERTSKRHLGLCLETQGSPASLEHQGFPSIILDKDEKYQYTTTFKFGIMKD